MSIPVSIAQAWTIRPQDRDLLVHDYMLLTIAVEHTQPTFATVDPHARAAFIPCVGFDPVEQRQPALHPGPAARGDDADLADIGIDEDCRSSRLDRISIPREPQK